jgi:hypothetical protein
MNVSQALKKKARLVKEINDKWLIVKNNNSIISGNQKKFDISNELELIEQLTNELVELKTKIHLANGPVYSKIFLMSELKSALKNVESINTTEGIMDNGRYGTPSTTFYVADMDEIAKRKYIKALGYKIDSLQDELDYHNATTVIG